MKDKSPQDSRSLVVALSDADGAVPADAFIRLMSETLKVLKGVDAATSDGGTATMTWGIVAAKMESPITMSLAGHPKRSHPDRSRPVVDETVRLMRRIERGEPISSKFAALLPKLKDIGRISDGLSISFSAPDEGSITPSLKWAANAEAIMKSSLGIHFALGELEGNLDELNAHGALKAILYHAITNEPVQLTYGEELWAKVHSLMRKRVKVRGRIKRNPIGVALSIDVDDIQLVERQLLRLSEMPAIDLAGGVESSEYIRRLRDEE